MGDDTPQRPAVGELLANAGPVRLTIPPEPAMSRVARLAASGMASLAGFTLDEVEDIRLVVSEICIALIELGAGEPIELALTISADGFSASGSTHCEGFEPASAVLELSRMVLTSASVEHGIEAREGNAVMWAVVARRLAA